MRFNTAIIAAALAAVCAADRMVITTCPKPYNCRPRGEYYVNSGAKFNIDTNGGCRDRGIPHMVEFCIDHGKGRAHFRFENQHKRCLAVKVRKESRTEWEEVKCNWKRDADVAEEVDDALENAL